MRIFSLVKRQKSVILLFLLVFALCSVSSGKYSGGTGEPNDPYLIATPNDLNSIGLDPNDWDKHFKMIADINMSGITSTQFNVIGDYPYFTGVFDGNNHAIANSGWALIEEVSGQTAVIKNIVIINADVNDPGYGGLAFLVGRLRGGQVLNCHIINGKMRAENISGLLVGINESQVINCSASGTCYGYQRMGGLVGETREQGTIMNCYSDANVTVKYGMAGGLVGIHGGDLILNCYSTGTVEGLENSDNIGGLVGSNSEAITNCYATGPVSGIANVGGLAGSNSGIISGCYFLTASGPDNGYGQPLTDEQMKQQANFVDWDFINAWNIGENQTYPFLRRHLPSDINKDGETNFYDFAILAEHWLSQQ